MESFLLNLAKKVLALDSDNLQKVCIIFPNRRAALFFRYHLSALIKKPVWLPGLYSLEDFVIMLSGSAVPSQLSLLFRLYTVYSARGGKHPFNEFINWGNTLLADFNEIDQYLTDGYQLFTDIDEAKAISHWNPDGNPLTPFEKQYLEFYRSIAPLFREFRDHLSGSGLAYPGLAFSRLIGELSEEKFSRWNTIFFAGFNALTTSERKLIEFLTGIGKAKLAFDFDTYYLDDEKQEAGSFLRLYFRMHPEWNTGWDSQNYRSGSKTIEITGIPGNVGQAKYAGNILEKLIATGHDPTEIAVVLVDENVLMPVLNSIPESVEAFNVTMGFPLKLTPLFSLTEAVFRLMINSETLSARGGDKSERQRLYFLKDILKVILHPNLADFYIPPKGNANTQVVRTVLNAEDSITYLRQHAAALMELAGNSLNESLKNGEPLQLIKILLSILKSNTEQQLKREDTIGQGARRMVVEYIYQFALIIEQIEELVNESSLALGINVLHQIFSELVSVTKIPFFGEPLRGIQVMGMLETRVLDFRTVLLLSANEGMLPKNKHMNTFLPEDIRKNYGFPSYHERNAVFAYHFYRLLQRAENVHLLYNSEGDELGGGERSRFLTQLLHELPQYNPGIQIKERLISVPPAAQATQVFSISKNQEIMKALEAYAQNGFSPTAISTYLNCSLQFCLSHLFKLQESETLDETLDARVLGNIIHEVFEKLFAPFTGMTLTSQDYRVLFASAKKQLNDSLLTRFDAAELKYGKNLLMTKVAEKLIINFLKTEEAQLQNRSMKIILLEKFLTMDFEVKNAATGKVINVVLKGKVDRIDSVDDSIRIIDYKTGSVQESELKANSVKEIPELKEPSKLIQLFWYAWLFSKSGIQEGPFVMQSGIIPLRTPSKYFISSYVGKRSEIELSDLKEFEDTLEEIFRQLFDPEVPFTQVEDALKCKNCSFREFCGRVII